MLKGPNLGVALDFTNDFNKDDFSNDAAKDFKQDFTNGFTENISRDFLYIKDFTEYFTKVYNFTNFTNDFFEGFFFEGF